MKGKTRLELQVKLQNDGSETCTVSENHNSRDMSSWGNRIYP
jgi:hypothetical protein